MTIDDFARNAFKGGWQPSKFLNYTDHENIGGAILFFSTQGMHMMLLDPLAWHAVGIVEMWRDEITGCQNDSCSFCDGYQSPITGWEYQMHRMIDVLAEGKTIEQYLESL